MSSSLVYLLPRPVLQMLAQLARDGGAKDVELLVLRPTTRRPTDPATLHSGRVQFGAAEHCMTWRGTALFGGGVPAAPHLVRIASMDGRPVVASGGVVSRTRGTSPGRVSDSASQPSVMAQPVALC
jgi:hypothetical protein